MGGDRRVLLGRIVGVFGVRGWIKLESHTSPRTALFDYQPWTLRLRANERPLVVAEAREQGRGLVARIDGVDSREAAEALIGGEIWVARDALPPPAAGEYYWVDLENLRVRTVDGQDLGRVSHLFPTGANDVLVVRDGTRERLIPFIVDDVIRRVDFESGWIDVDWDPEF